MNYPYLTHDEKPKERDQKPRKSDTEPKNDDDCTPYTSPTYVIKHRSPVDMQEYLNDKSAKINAAIPKELVIEVDLPLLNSASDVTLDVTEELITLQSEKHARYKLELNLPYKVYEDSGNAKFDKDQRKLIITLPVRRLQGRCLADIGREDSGVESDTSCQTHESSSADYDSAESESHKSEENFPSDSPEFVSDSIVENGRTTTDSADPFLDPDKHYLLPTFTCNVFDGVIAFTLHVKNVDPSSVVHHFLKDYCGVAVRLISIGAGHFPVCYVLYIKFPNGAALQEDCLNIETWDNNVVIQMQLLPCDDRPTEFYAGTDEGNLTKYDIPEPAAIAKKFAKLKKNACDQAPKSCLIAEVTEVTDSTLVLEIKPDKEELDNGNPAVEQEELKVDDSSDIITENTSTPSVDQRRQLPLTKSRTFSESSGEDINLSPRKGILKHAGRVSRSLSESSVDDYSWSSSLDIVGHSGGSDICIPEEDEEGAEHKKTVRFNDDISEKVYRNNSSILGQRKKNQRKIRNKKRAQERRASESENSEGEADKEKDKEPDINNDGEVTVSEVHMQCTADVVINSTEQQHSEAEDDPETASLDPQHQNRNSSVSGQSFVRSTPAVSQIQLENDLICQLSM